MTDDAGDLIAAQEPVGVVGLGVVGGAMAAALQLNGIPVRGYDPFKEAHDVTALGQCRVIFICVGTPAGSGASAVWDAMVMLAAHLATGTTIAIKSTVPPGTTDQLSQVYPRFNFASAPEFLVAADPLRTFLNPDRIVVGANQRRSRLEVVSVLAKLAQNDPPVVYVQAIEAELIKLASNAFLSAKVAMANELFEICDAYGVNWGVVQAGVGLDPRIGPAHLTVTPERGFGGACLPKDLDALIHASVDAGYRPSLLAAVRRLNARVRGFVDA